MVMGGMVRKTLSEDFTKMVYDEEETKANEHQPKDTLKRLN